MEYGRRYTMNSLLGIATKDADTDAATQSAVFVSENQIKALRDAIAVSVESEAEFCKKAGVPDVERLLASRFAGAMNHLKEKARGARQ
jgi:TPP-dependent pyruvate/acetoin dehydrogenase alpha subunit